MGKTGDYLSRDFTWAEFAYSRIAVENGLDNEPPIEVRFAIMHLVQRLLQPLRIAYGGPVAIISGYRSPKVNLLAGGVPTSQHQTGEAADCFVPDTERLLEVLVESGLLFDQAILYTKRRFLHLSLKVRGNNRRQILINRTTR